jgi:hypothetical protein
LAVDVAIERERAGVFTADDADWHGVLIASLRSKIERKSKRMSFPPVVAAESESARRPLQE